MDGIIITAAVILAVISIIEVVTFFLAMPSRSAPAYASVLPVFEGDEKLRERLEYLSMKGCGRKRVILVDYTATPEQAELCRQFVHSSPDAVFIRCSELEDYFKGMFV
ncbi:MAG: hypothetical protein Q4A05_10935 [Ruminococcus sp.]|nr:hypothetical protein [Ruminococcus sp.]